MLHTVPLTVTYRVLNSVTSNVKDVLAAITVLQPCYLCSINLISNCMKGPAPAPSLCQFIGLLSVVIRLFCNSFVNIPYCFFVSSASLLAEEVLSSTPEPACFRWAGQLPPKSCFPVCLLSLHWPPPLQGTTQWTDTSPHNSSRDPSEHCVSVPFAAKDNSSGLTESTRLD